jgi:membrane fusion protein, multidrug efflux system
MNKLSDMKPGILISIFFFLLIAGCRNTQPVSVEEEPPRVRVVEPVVREISNPVHAAGILSTSDEIKLSFKTGGIIESVKVTEGEKVKKGQLLASLNLAEINAANAQARNAYEKALRDFTRAENLYADSVATLEMKQNATTALDVARSNLEVARFNLEHSSIVAPSDGVILKQLARQNELISSGYPVFLFGSSGKYWKVRTGITDRDIVRISPGDSAFVTFDAWPGVKFRAVVGETGSMADPYTGTYEAELLVDGSGYRLLPGFVAAVEIIPSLSKSAVTVPIGSLVDADGSIGYVFAVNDSGFVEKIRVGIESIPGETVVVTGLPPGMDIVSEGAAWLKDGMKVRVISDQP